MSGKAVATSRDIPMSPKVTNRPITPADLPAISALHREVFGPGRFARTAYRVREGRPAGRGAISPYCRLAMLGERLVAAVQFTEITVGGKDGALLLGPLVVALDAAGQGFGRGLVGEALAAAKAAGIRLIVLVGDEPYYGRFGFTPVAVGRITLPGPVNPARMLAVELQPNALADYQGMIAAK
jgi:predicted N-acetyltransferase YhbS